MPDLPAIRIEHGPRGLEIVEPCPGLLRGGALVGLAVCLPLLLILLLDDALALAVSGVLLVFGRATVLLVVAGALLLLALDSRSRWRYRFGRERLGRMLEVGPLTLWREEIDAARIADAGCDPAAPAVLRIERAGGPALRLRCADAAQARHAAAAVQAWRADPGSIAVSAAPPGVGEWLGETGLSLLLGRLRHAPALLLLGAALLGIAAAVQHLHGNVGPDAEPRMAEGELLRYRIMVREPDARERRLGHREGKAWVELGVEWRDAEGRARQAWWRSRGEVDLSRLAELRLWPLARSIGLPWLEFALPESAVAAWSGADGRLSWQGPARADSADAEARDLFRQADRLLENLALLQFARPADWRVVYDPAAPNQARLLRWQEGEQQAVQASPRLGLLALLLASALIAWLSLLWLLAGRSVASTGLLVALLAGSPWWSAEAARLPVLLGLPDGVAEGVAGLFRSTAPLALRGHALLEPLPSPSPDDPARLLRWEPMGAQAAELLPALGLDRLPLPITLDDDAALADEEGFEVARDALRQHVAERVLVWDDRTLVDFLRRLRTEAYGRFNDVLVNLPDCALSAQAARAEVTRQWIESVLRPECDETGVGAGR